MARRLDGDVSADAVLRYAVLFVPAWWAWVGYAYYSNRFSNDDLFARLFTLLQMAAAIVLAVRAHDALEEGSRGFALAYGAFRLLLALRYVIAAWKIEETRALASRQAVGFGIAGALWLLSATVPAPTRFWLWGVALLVDVGTPFSLGRLNQRHPLNSEHLQERFGNFTLIVLGEGVLSMVGPVRDVIWGFENLFVAGAALTIGFAIWWLYFETLDSAPVEEAGEQGGARHHHVWLYGQLPFAMAMAAGAASLVHLVHGAGDAELAGEHRWLFAGATTMVFASLALITWSYAASGSWQSSRPLALSRLLTAAVALGVGIFGGGLSAPRVVAIVSAAAIAQIAIDIVTKRSAPRRQDAAASVS